MTKRNPEVHRIIQSVNLDASLVVALRAEAAVTGTSLSRALENRLRLGMGMELPPPPAEREHVEEATRTERAMLDELKRAGPGWHSSVNLSLTVGVSHHVGEKALKALGRRGEIIRWGDANEFSDGRPGGSTWGTMQPQEAVRRVWAAHERAPVDFYPLKVLQKLCLGMSKAEVQKTRDFVAEKTGQPATWDDLGLENFAENIDRRNARERERVAEAAR